MGMSLRVPRMSSHLCLIHLKKFRFFLIRYEVTGKYVREDKKLEYGFSWSGLIRCLGLLQVGCNLRKFFVGVFGIKSSWWVTLLCLFDPERSRSGVGFA